MRSVRHLEHRARPSLVLILSSIYGTYNQTTAPCDPSLPKRVISQTQVIGRSPLSDLCPPDTHTNIGDHPSKRTARATPHQTTSAVYRDLGSHHMGHPSSSSLNLPTFNPRSPYHPFHLSYHRILLNNGAPIDRIPTPHCSNSFGVR